MRTSTRRPDQDSPTLESLPVALPDRTPRTRILDLSVLSSEATAHAPARRHGQSTRHVSTAGLRLPESPAPTPPGAYVWWWGLPYWGGIPGCPSGESRSSALHRHVRTSASADVGDRSLRGSRRGWPGHRYSGGSTVWM